MRITVRPVADPKREIDLTSHLVSAIAAELWRLYGGNDQLNWLEAESHLRRIVGEAQANASATAASVIEASIASAVAEGPAGVEQNRGDEPFLSRRPTPAVGRGASPPRAAPSRWRQVLASG